VIEPHNCPPPHGYIVAGFGVLATLAQAIPIGDPSIDKLKDYGTQGLLAVAVAFLWATMWKKLDAKDAKLDAKDAILMQIYESTAKSVATNVVVVEQMSKTLQEIRETVDELSTVRAVIAKP
jgi:hypothetical protein